MADTDFVVLRSNDDFSFAVPRNIALASGTLKSMLDEDISFREAENKTCDLQYRGIIVQKVIEYLAFKVQYSEFASTDIREDFAERIDPYIALELLTAADFLDI